MVSFVIFADDVQEALRRVDELGQTKDYQHAEVVLVDLTPDQELNKSSDLQNLQIIQPKDGAELPVYGELLEEARSKLTLENNWYLCTGRFPIVENNIHILDTALSEDSHLAAVGGSSEDFFSYRQSNKEVKCVPEKAMYLEPEVVMLRGEVVDRVGGFDSEIHEKRKAFKEFCLRVLRTKEYGFKICRDAVFVAEHPSKNIETENDESDRRHMMEKWGLHYLNLYGNSFIVDMMPPSNKQVARVLEIGCDLGATLFDIKEMFPNADCYGCDINPAAVSVASLFADACVCNIETEELPWEKHYFDCIIFGDVLEHLRDPEGVLCSMKDYLTQDGYIVASIPNLMHISVIDGLLRGNFTYTEVGLLDKTHIHMFTYNEMVGVFSRAGYRLDAIEAKTPPVSSEEDQLIDQLVGLNLGAEKFMYLAFQYLVRAVVDNA